MAFKMRSGNKVSFKMMGSSPAKHVDDVETGKNRNKEHADAHNQRHKDGDTHGEIGSPDNKWVKSTDTKPLQQKGPVDEKNPDLFEGEMEGTWVYEGSDLQERIIDLEDRIEFMQSDLEDAETEKEKKKYESAVKKLEQELAILQRERKQKEKE